MNKETNLRETPNPGEIFVIKGIEYIVSNTKIDYSRMRLPSVELTLKRLYQVENSERKDFTSKEEGSRKISHL